MPENDRGRAGQGGFLTRVSEMLDYEWVAGVASNHLKCLRMTGVRVFSPDHLSKCLMMTGWGSLRPPEMPGCDGLGFYQLTI